MTVGVIGSRSICDFRDFNLEIPIGTSKIVSGGANGVDTLSKSYALSNNIPFLEILPNYQAFGKSAPFIRNDEIISTCDFILAIWDGKSKGTKYVINKCIKNSKPIKVLIY